jgi:pimeloyl-ACP methyl ester carboxylesterase
VRLPYLEQGDASGVPLVFLHAYADSWRSFEQVLAHTPPSLHVFALTQRGHGDAEKPPSGYTAADYAADLTEFMDAARLDAVVLVASSSAGFTAQRFAADHPDRTLGLVLIGVPWSLADKPGLDDFSAALSGLRDPVDPSFVREFVEATAGDAVPGDFLETMTAESRKVPAHVWREAFAALIGEVPAAEGGAVVAPTLLIWGDRDPFVPRGDQDTFVAAMPRCQLSVYEGTGHIVHWEEPERVAADVSEFAASLAGASAVPSRAGRRAR